MKKYRAVFSEGFITPEFPKGKYILRDENEFIVATAALEEEILAKKALLEAPPGTPVGLSKVQLQLREGASQIEKERHEWDWKMTRRAAEIMANHKHSNFALAEFRTQEGAGTWLRLQSGTGYNWSVAEIKCSKKTIETNLQQVIEAQVAVFKLAGGLR